MERLERICGDLDRMIRNRLLQIRLQAEIRGFLRGNDTKSGTKTPKSESKAANPLWNGTD